MNILNPGKSFLKQAFLQTLIGVLCFNVAVPAALWAGPTTADTNGVGTVADNSTPLEASQVGSSDAPDFAIVGSQRREHKNQDGSVTTTQLDSPDIRLTPVSFASFKDIAITANEEKSELYFTAGNDTHVITGIRVTAQPILNADGSILFIPTDKGIYWMVVKHFIQYGFVAPVPPCLAAPLGVPDARIKKLTAIERGTPRPDGADLGGLLSEGDLFAEVDTTSGPRTLRYPIAEMTQTFLAELVGVVIEMILANPTPDKLATYSKFLQTNDAVVKSYLQRRETLLRSGETSLPRDAFARLAERSGNDFLTGLATEIAAIVPAARDEFPADSSQMISATRLEALLGKAPLTKKEQAALLAKELGQLELGPMPQQTAVGKFASTVSKLWDSIASPKVLLTVGGALSTGALAAHYAPDSYFGRVGAPLIQAFSSVWNGLLQTPGLHFLADPQSMKTGADFILDHSHSLAWLGGALLLAPGLYFGSLALGYCAGWLRYMFTQSPAPELPTFTNLTPSAVGRTIVDTFNKLNAATFQIMRDGYLKVNRGVEGILGFLCGQRNLFQAMAAGVSPYDLNAWNSPFASPETLAQNRDRLNQSLEERAIFNAAALDVAAAVLISEAKNVPVGVLLEERKFGGTFTVDQLLGSSEGVARLTEVMTAARSILEEVRDDANLKFKAADLRGNLRVYARVAERVQAQIAANPSLKSPLRKLQQATFEFFDDHTKAFLGKNGLTQYQRQYRTPITRETGGQAQVMYGVDYLATAGGFAMSSPEEALITGITPRLVGNMSEQVLNYTAQAPTDIQAGLGSEPLSNPNRPVGELLFDGGTRKQTLFEAVGNLLTGWVWKDANSAGFLEFWHKWIRNMRDGWFVRTCVAGITIGGIFLAKAHGHEMHFSGGIDFTTSTLSTTWVWLMQKMSVGWDVTNSSIFIGYAMVWPMISMWMRQNGSLLGENLKKVQSIGGRIVKGVETQDPTLWQNAVREGKEIYAQKAMEIPEELNIPAEKFTPEQAFKFLAYMQRNCPIPTGQSKTFDVLLNLVWGTGFSVIVANIVSSDITNHPPSFWRLLTTAGCITASYYGSILAAKKVVNPLTAKLQVPAKQALGGLQKFRSWCATALLGRKPVDVH